MGNWKIEIRVNVTDFKYHSERPNGKTGTPIATADQNSGLNFRKFPRT